jgi:hypothetical protein
MAAHRKLRGVFAVYVSPFHCAVEFKDLEEEHPAELFEPLRVAVGAGVLAHDVLDGFDDVADGHELPGLLYISYPPYKRNM